MRKAAALAGLVVLLIMGLLLTESGRSLGRAALLVAGLFAPSDRTPLSLFARPPSVSGVEIMTAEQTIEGRLFTPNGEGPFGALILVAGYPSNVDDQQLASLASDLARMGIVVVIPRLPALQKGSLSTTDVAALVAVFEWLAEQPTVAGSHIGFAGFCVGSSLALLAAENPRISHDVRLVNAFGGYFDLTSLLRAVATQSADYRGRQVAWLPATPTVALVTQNILDQLAAPRDQAFLQNFFINGGQEQELKDSLTPSGYLAYRLLTTTDQRAFDQLLAQAPAASRRHLATLSPRTRAGDLHARIFIMHDESDPYIPVGESYRLAEAIGDPAQMRQGTFRIFAHVRPQRTTDRLILAQDGIRLVGYLGDLLHVLMPNP